MRNVPEPISCAFVTGARGLLGNSLVRLLAARAVTVKALLRSRKSRRSLTISPSKSSDCPTTMWGIRSDSGESSCQSQPRLLLRLPPEREVAAQFSPGRRFLPRCGLFPER
jgi:NAD(P)-dependent dehydrogenase (short-subunit alcohol dehydrogenase family)